MKNKKLLIYGSLFLVLIILPIFVLAACDPANPGATQGSLVPCCGPDCNFGSLLQLFNNVISFVTLDLALPLATITFIYAGFTMMTAGDNASKRSNAKRMMLNVVIGFAVLLSAFLIVRLIVTTLLDPSISSHIKI